MFDFDWKVYSAFILVLLLMALPALRRKLLGQIAKMDAGDLAEQLSSENAPILIDLRAAKVFSYGHIKNAINIPCDETNSCLDKVLDRLQSKPRHTQVILICESDLASSRLYQRLLKSGADNVFVLTGGFNNWKRVGLQATREIT